MEIVDDCTLSAMWVFRLSILNMFNERFPIDLVPIPLRGLKVIIVMDWLGPNRVVIDCERQLVRFRTPSAGELVITSERASHGLTLCLATWARRLLQQGCLGFLLYVADSRVETATKFNGVPILRDFVDVFPEELPGVPP